MRILTILLGGLLVLACSWLNGGQAAEGNASDAVKRIKQLKAEKQEVLANRVQRFEQLHAVGMVDRNTLVRAQIDVLDARLAATTPKADRIKILEQRVALYRQLEKSAARLLAAPIPPKSGERPAPSFAELASQSTVARIDAEIELEREKARLED